MSTKKEPRTAFRLFLGNDKQDAKIEAEHPDLSNAEWIPAAKVGQVVDISAKLHTVTAESLESSLGSWKGRNIYKNHETEIKGHTILDEKFENPFLSFLLDSEIVAALANGGGGSIDAIATLVEEGKIRTMSGVGYSVLDKDKTPACTKEAGCGLAGKGAGEDKGDNVNVEGGIMKPIINIDKVGDEVKSLKDLDNKEEIKEEMADKKEEITFTEAQVSTIRAEAAKDVTDQMTATHQVAINDLEKKQAAELKALSETHVADLETQRKDVTKHVEMVETLSSKFALSPEAKKELIDAKTPEDVYTLLAKLKVSKAEPVIAAEGKGEKTGCGIVMGTEIEGKAPKVIKIEQIGNWDPYTGKYVPTYREEVE